MKIKRIGIGLLLVFGLAAASGVTYSQAPSEGVARFRLELSRVPHSGEIRESVLKLVVKLTNTSTGWLSEDPCSAGGGLYRFTAVYNGVPIEETQEARSRREAREEGEAKGGICTGHGGRRIKPGEHWDDVLYYDAAKPGKYELRVERKDFVQSPPRIITVTSNTLTVVVDEPDSGRPD